MKKIIAIFFTIAKSVTFILLLFFLSAIIVSYSLSNEKRINPYCINKYQNEVIKINDTNIKDYSYKFDCNTLYLQITLLTDKNDDLLKTLKIIKEEVSEYDCFIHIALGYNDKTYYASISKDSKEIFLLGKEWKNIILLIYMKFSWLVNYYSYNMSMKEGIIWILEI